MKQIEKYLSQHGYKTSVRDDAVEVADPVVVMSGTRRWVEYVIVSIRTMRAAQRFIAQR